VWRTGASARCGTGSGVNASPNEIRESTPGVGNVSKMSHDLNETDGWNSESWGEDSDSC